MKMNPILSLDLKCHSNDLNEATSQAIKMAKKIGCVVTVNMKDFNITAYPDGNHETHDKRPKKPIPTQTGPYIYNPSMNVNVYIRLKETAKHGNDDIYIANIYSIEGKYVDTHQFFSGCEEFPNFVMTDKDNHQI